MFQIVGATMGFLLSIVAFRGAFPSRTNYIFAIASLGITFFAGLFATPIFPAALPVTSSVQISIFFGLAVASPVAGMLEGWIRRKRPVPYSSKRFPMHLATNLCGALIATTFLVLVRRTAGGEPVPAELLLSVFLPMSLCAALYFVRSQQLSDIAHAGHGSSIKVEPDESWFYENSLNRWHQFLNVIHLTVAAFVSTTSLFYALGDTMRRVRAGSPPTLGWETVVIVSLTLMFLMLCGLPLKNQDRTLYMTFLTGTPAALCVAILWFGMYELTPLRNVIAFTVVLVAYGIYVALVAIDERRHGSFQLFYFVSLAMLLVILSLMASLFV